MVRLVRGYFGIFCALVLLSVCSVFVLASYALAEGNTIFAMGVVSFMALPDFLIQYWLLAFMPVSIGGVVSLWKHNPYNFFVGLACLPSWSYVLTYSLLSGSL